MVSTSVSIVFALSFLSLGSGFHFRKRESGYDQVVQCIDKAFVFGEESDISEDTCYYKVAFSLLGRNMVDFYKRHGSKVSKKLLRTLFLPVSPSLSLLPPNSLPGSEN